MQHIAWAQDERVSGPSRYLIAVGPVPLPLDCSPQIASALCPLFCCHVKEPQHYSISWVFPAYKARNIFILHSFSSEKSKFLYTMAEDKPAVICVL